MAPPLVRLLKIELYSAEQMFPSWNSRELLPFVVVSLLLLVRPTCGRRMCGKVLTNELARVCTKEGMRGPCLHGAESTRKRRSADGSGEEEQQMLWRMFATQLLEQKADAQEGTGAERIAWLKELVQAFRQQKHQWKGRSGALSRMKRAKGIVDKCCSGEGCDAQFLDSFCCDEVEEQTFREREKA